MPVRKPECVVPFSSAKKWSGASFAEGAFVMGAAQFVLAPAEFAEVEMRVAELASTCRVLVVAHVDGFTEEGEMVGTARPVGFVTIRDEIRTSAAETIGYFCEQGVELNVISGDDPRTVSSIAQVVGVPGADAYVDAVKEAANVWAVPVIDLNSICGLYPNADSHTRYFHDAQSDRLHPNAEGHYRMAKALAYQLSSYPANFE